MSQVGLERQVRRALRQRWWLMLAYVVGWFVWQILAIEPVARWAVSTGVPVLAVQGVGFGAWFLSLLLTFRFIAVMRRNRAIAGILNDELAVANRRRCWTLGYFAFLLALVPAVVAAAFQVVDALAVTQMLMMVAVSVPMLAFVWFERDTTG
ncbi:MAG: hypothetical protein KGJ78_00490 [Alphaproteobacteria bacterium]|nr:hypothetical protein [Alphaproteobacteria bacterium]